MIKSSTKIKMPAEVGVSVCLQQSTRHIFVSKDACSAQRRVGYRPAGLA
jgi:hypothetical protein